MPRSTGTCKVKLGPIALVYNGSGTFVEKDETAHRFVVDAKGKDKRGNGTAGAKVTLSMDEAAGGTAVEVLTDLSITGKPAQFGRGVMQDVSDKLLGQFVQCLEDRLSVPAEPVGAAPDAGPASENLDAGPVSEPVAAPETEPVPTGPRRDDAINLGATVLPVLLKSYWKQGLVLLLVVAVLIWLISR